MTTDRKIKTEQLAQISNASLLEEGGYSSLVRRSIFFIVIMLFVFVLWSIFTKVDEVAVSFGDVQPLQDVQ